VVANEELHVILLFAMQIGCQGDSICFHHYRPKMDVNSDFENRNIFDGHFQLRENYIYLSKDLLE
jgi:hypothetical protein